MILTNLIELNNFLIFQKINWDQQATIVFPLIFLVFNISYWLHYLCINKL